MIEGDGEGDDLRRRHGSHAAEGACKLRIKLGLRRAAIEIGATPNSPDLDILGCMAQLDIKDTGN